MSIFYHAADKEEKYDITEEMPESTMEETIEYELSEESEEANRIAVYSAINDYLRIDPVDDCSQQ